MTELHSRYHVIQELVFSENFLTKGAKLLYDEMEYKNGSL